MENELLKWMQLQKDNGIGFTKRIIKEKADEITTKLNLFKATKKWF